MAAAIGGLSAFADGLYEGIRPRDGFIEVTPQQYAGYLSDPPRSLT